MQDNKKNCRRTIHVADDAKLPDNFINEVPVFFPKSGTTIHKKRNEIKVYQCGDLSINVKKYGIPAIINRVLYSLSVRSPKARSSFFNAIEIRKRGFNTPKPFGYIIERRGWLMNYSYFISEQINNTNRLPHGCTDKNIALALAAYTVRLHDAGLLHRDYSPGNILYKVTDGVYSFTLIDINRFIIKNGKIGPFAAASSMMRAFEDREMLKLFTGEYARLRSLNKTLFFGHVLLLQYIRSAYVVAKRVLKKIPGAKYVTAKSIKKG